MMSLTTDPAHTHTISSAKEQLTLRIRQAVLHASSELQLEASFARGRRSNDLVVIKLRGLQQHAHIMTNHLVEVFPEITVDLLASESQDSTYSLTVVATAKTDEDHSVSEEERRYQLLRIYGGVCA